MSSQSLQEFKDQISQSVSLQEKIDLIQSPMELILLAKAIGIELTNDDLKEIAQTAFQQWVSQLSGSIQNFFGTAKNNQELNQRVRQCKSSIDVVALAKEYQFEFTEADLRQAAFISQRIEGFSFEKLWFKELGLI
jgi:predicted ribosomally synthesized peptide with nif11-like leader